MSSVGDAAFDGGGEWGDFLHENDQILRREVKSE